MTKYDAQAHLEGFAEYKSHRVVRAAKIRGVTMGETMQIDIEPSGSVFTPSKGKPAPQPGWYVIAYDDGYISFCPPKQFAKGYAPPVAGYREQPTIAIEVVNDFKRAEEGVLRMLDQLRDSVTLDIDHRWLAIGWTQLEQAFMAINRAVFKPGRVKFPGE